MLMRIGGGFNPPTKSSWHDHKHTLALVAKYLQILQPMA